MQKKNQENEDELLAIAIANSEAELYDKNFRFIDEEPINTRHIRSPPFVQMTHHLEHRDMDERFNQFFNDFKGFQEIGAVDDSIPVSVLEHMFETPHRARQAEEVKHPRPAEQVNRGNFNKRMNNHQLASRSNIMNAGRSIAAPNQNMIERGKGGYRGRRIRRPLNNRQNHEDLQRIPSLFNDPANYMFDDEGNQASYEELAHLDDDHFDKGKGFKESDLRRLQVIEFRNFKVSEKCSICIEDFKNYEKVVKLRCEHWYHESCIKEWLSRKKICAVCKKEVNI
jgi:hypothetical protein